MNSVIVFVVWMFDFEQDLKSYDLRIANVNHEIGGNDVTLVGSKEEIIRYLETEYFPGMEDEDKQEILDSIK